jgi:rubrerythrin
MVAAFDIDKFLENSRALDLSGIDWEKAKDSPLTKAEIRCLTYMIDVETYTIAYLRDLLNTHAIKDPEISDFLPCWAYEESYHGRALEKVLEASGAGLDRHRPRSFQHSERLWESIKDLGGILISRLSEDFTAVHMTWGAIQELTTLTGYNQLARKSQNVVLIEVARRIIRDESRHFGFYYNKAKDRLSSSSKAQSLTNFLLKRFWTPVGAGIKPEADVDFITAYVFGDERGQQAAHHVDATIAKLPGLEWFDRVESYVKRSCQRLVKEAPWNLNDQMSEQTS